MQKQRTGLSRWELLALGGVVGTAGALLPAIAQSVDGTRAEENQRATVCAHNLKKVALGLAMYMQDYDERMPRAALGASSVIAYGWADAVKPYIKYNAYYQCPSEKHPAQDNPTKPGYTDYWLNKNVSGVSARDMRSPTTLISMGDGDGGSTSSTARYSLNKLPKSWIATANSPIARHNGQGFYAFADGHIKRYSYQVLLPNKPTFELN